MSLAENFIIFTMTMLVFFSHTWEEHITHKLRLGIISGPVEGLILLTLFCILIGIAGKTLNEYDIYKET